MKSEKMKINKPVYSYNKQGKIKTREIKTKKGTKEVPETIQKSFVIDCFKFGDYLILIPEYPGKDRENDFGSKSAKLAGLGTYIVKDRIWSKEYNMKGAGRKKSFGLYISHKDNNIKKLIRDLKQQQDPTKKDLIAYAQEHPKSYVAEVFNVKSKKAIAKVANKGDEAENLATAIEKIQSLGLSKEKTAELVSDLIKNK